MACERSSGAPLTSAPLTWLGVRVGVGVGVGVRVGVGCFLDLVGVMVVRRAEGHVGLVEEIAHLVGGGDSVRVRVGVRVRVRVRAKGRGPGRRVRVRVRG